MSLEGIGAPRRTRKNAPALLVSPGVRGHTRPCAEPGDAKPRRLAGNAWFGQSCHLGGEGGGSAELGPHRQLQPRALGAALAAHGVQPPAPTSLLPTSRLGARGRLSPGPTSACVPAPARPFLLLLPALSSWVFVSGGRPSSLGRRSPPLGFCGSPKGRELTLPARPRALQAVRARLVQGLPGRPVGGLRLRSPRPPTPPPSLCPNPAPTPLRPVPAGRLQRQDLPQDHGGHPAACLLHLHAVPEVSSAVTGKTSSRASCLPCPSTQLLHQRSFNISSWAEGSSRSISWSASPRLSSEVFDSRFPGVDGRPPLSLFLPAGWVHLLPLAPFPRSR
ncbi:translation initiation factor IF-2-like [Moschus berezovskii]|uniref:translation initiation factor IF-2-like n=1 Tax=Moschus berezovskii TaxID=68408 RepID=UPI002444A290|nr:translation initiation factor IF-2-like [Moschus berezovskii]